MKKTVVGAVAALLATTLIAGGWGATAAGKDEHSSNITRLARVPIVLGKGVKGEGSDMAFDGNLLIAGSYQGVALYRILDGPPYLRQISFYPCPATQDDVSVEGHYLFVSIDSPGSNNVKNAVCNNTDNSMGKEGIRVVDISNPRQPRQVKFVETDCGSHTHTLVPDGKNTYIYVESYPLGAPTANCNPESHRKISVIGFPTNDPTQAKVVSTPDVSPEIGCHDVGVYPAIHLAAAACIGESQIWDISDPAHPKILSRIYNPAIMIHHSAAITWDGKYAVIGDEFLGSVTGECLGNRNSPSGALWFYDITDPKSPQLVGYYNVSRNSIPTSTQDSYIACTTHNYNLVPMKDPHRYIATVAYRASGLSVVDFTDPANAKEVGYYLPTDKLPDPWTAYWYNGRIYTSDNGSRLGISVYQMKGLEAQDANYFDGLLNPQTEVRNFQN